MNKIIYVFTLILFLLSTSCYGYKNISDTSHNLDSVALQWADSVMQTLSLKQKIGQMFIIRSASNSSAADYAKIEGYIKDYNIGGICFFKGHPNKQVQLINKWQKLSKIPMFISMDAEWGLEMRLKENAMAFPKQMTLGAIYNDKYIEKFAKALALQLKRVGVNMSFAPCIDVNNNPYNPVINYRSFGESPENVALKGIIYMKTLEDNGIVAVAKHFPGHGNTETDSHHTLPVINQNKAELDTIELFPFKKLIEHGLKAIMNAHVYIPELDKIKRPSSMSPNVVTDILQKELGFKGLIMTDGLEMGAIREYKPAGEIEVAAIKAGNDILLLPLDLEKAINSILKEIEKGNISEAEINKSCKKILITKYKHGIHKTNSISEKNVIEDINNIKDKALRRNLYQEAITLIKNQNKILPLNLSANIKTATVIISDDNSKYFRDMMNNYCKSDFYEIKTSDNYEKFSILLKKLDTYDRLIVVLASKSNDIKSKFGFSKGALKGINTLALEDKSILCIAANPYLSSYIDNFNNFSAILIAYENTKDVMELVPQALFGAFTINGKLSISIKNRYPVLFRKRLEGSSVIKHPSQDEVDIKYGSFNSVDEIILEGIDIKAYPGCRVLAIHQGQLIYNKAFGKLDYNEDSPAVDLNTIYDLASVTKSIATTLAVMHLYDNAQIDIDKPISDYLTFLQKSNKKDITLRQAMSHQAGLVPFISFRKDFINNSAYKAKMIHAQQSNQYQNKIANKMYIRNDYKERIFDSIASSNLSTNNEVIYSDLGFILIGELIAKLSGLSLDKYLEKYFYSPLGLRYTTFNPLEKFKKDNIAPTANDLSFRQQKVQGYVHDDNAALLGGIAGHAGLFSTAEELGILMQMLLNGGVYGGKRYITEGVVRQFTKAQYPEYENRKACGFDKPGLEENDPLCEGASKLSFGHSGFTGTYAWADPEHELIYVFISNRTYPSAANNKILNYDIRTRIHQAFYNIIEIYEKTLSE